MGKGAIDWTINDDPLPDIGGNFNCGAAFPALLRIGGALEVAKFIKIIIGIIGTAALRPSRCATGDGRITRGINPRVNYQAACDVRTNINTDNIFSTHINIAALAIIAANRAFNVNANGIVAQNAANPWIINCR